MDRIRKKTKAPHIMRVGAVAAAVLLLISGCVALANIDFHTYRVDKNQLTIETVKQGAMEIKVSANGQLLSKNIEQLAAQVSGRVAAKDIKPGAVVQVGQ